MKTVGQVLDDHRGIGPGFDLIRVVLAFSVIAWHSIPITTGSATGAATEPWWILVYAIVPVFFALSGFLVTGSGLRLSVGPFVASRALRILPALFVDTVISVLLFGTLLTTLPVREFLVHPQTLSYWLNIVGEIHFYLPGVFTDNPLTAVNGSLWTIKPELGCYLVMAFLIATGLIKRWPVVLLALVGVWSISWGAQMIPGDYPGKFYLEGNHSKLVIFFLVGSLAYLLRYRIPASPWLAGGVLVFMALCAALGEGAWLGDSRPFMLISAPLLTYLTIWLGLQKLPQLPLFNTGDYSYGIYLYGFPIQQVVVQLTGAHSPMATFLLTIVPVTLMAMFSWHVVEKPTLKLRKFLKPKAAAASAVSTETQSPTTATAEPTRS